MATPQIKRVELPAFAFDNTEGELAAVRRDDGLHNGLGGLDQHTTPAPPRVERDQPLRPPGRTQFNIGQEQPIRSSLEAGMVGCRREG